MTLKITDECINCGACEEVCPTQAIVEDGEAMLRIIDPARCTECVGFYERHMCQIECPVECCLPDPEHPETREQLLEKARLLFPGREFGAGPAIGT
ncbi:MAG: YfhL family 4Fe-4S dicluster ferredoxin [Myxococcota bacterium]|nr:YfhL family 4Fe-4S dicluster ferredoxin [Myxococcota bacterium]